MAQQNVQFNFIALDNVSPAAQKIAASLANLNLAAQGPAKQGLKQLADQFLNLNAQMKLTDPEHKRLLANIAQLPKIAQAAAASIMNWDAATKTMTVDFSRLGAASATTANAINRALSSSLNPLNQNITQFRTLLLLMNQLAQGGRAITPNTITSLQGRLAPIIASQGAAGIFGVNTQASLNQDAIAARTQQNFENQQALQAQRFANQQALIAQRAAASGGGGSSGDRGDPRQPGFSRLTPFGKAAYRTFTAIGVGIQSMQIGAGIGGGGGGFNPVQLLFLMNAFERLPAIAIPAAGALTLFTASVTALGKATADAGGLEKYKLQLEAILKLRSSLGGYAAQGIGNITQQAQIVSDQATNLAKSTGLPLGDVREGVATLQHRLPGETYQKAAATLAMEQGVSMKEAAKDLNDLVTSGGAKMEEFAAKYEITTQRIFGRARPTVAAFGDSITLANKILSGFGAEAEKMANTIPNIFERIVTSAKSLSETLGSSLTGFGVSGLKVILDGIQSFEAGLKSAFNDPSFQAFMKNGLAAFNSAIQAAGPAWREFGHALVNLVVDGIKNVVTWLPLLVQGLTALTPLFTGLVNAMDFVVKLSMLFAQGLKAIGDTLKPVLQFLKPLFDLLGSFANFIKEFILNAATQFVAWLKELANHAQEAWAAFLDSPLGQWLQDRVRDIQELANAVANFWNEHGDQIWQFLKDLGAGVVGLITLEFKWAVEWMQGLWKWLSDAAPIYKQVIIEIATAVGAILKEAWDWLFVDGNSAHLRRIVDLSFHLATDILMKRLTDAVMGNKNLALSVLIWFTLGPIGLNLKWFLEFMTTGVVPHDIKIGIEFFTSNPVTQWIMDQIGHSQGAIAQGVRAATGVIDQTVKQGTSNDINSNTNELSHPNSLQNLPPNENTNAGPAPYRNFGFENKRDTVLSAAAVALNAAKIKSGRSYPNHAPEINPFHMTGYSPDAMRGAPTIIVNINGGDFSDPNRVKDIAREVGDQINQNLRQRGPIQV